MRRRGVPPPRYNQSFRLPPLPAGLEDSAAAAGGQDLMLVCTVFAGQRHTVTAVTGGVRIFSVVVGAVTVRVHSSEALRCYLLAWTRAQALADVLDPPADRASRPGVIHSPGVVHSPGAARLVEVVWRDRGGMRPATNRPEPVGDVPARRGRWCSRSVTSIWLAGRRWRAPAASMVRCGRDRTTMAAALWRFGRWGCRALADVGLRCGRAGVGGCVAPVLAVLAGLAAVGVGLVAVFRSVAAVGFGLDAV